MLKKWMIINIIWMMNDDDGCDLWVVNTEFSFANTATSVGLLVHLDLAGWLFEAQWLAFWFWIDLRDIVFILVITMFVNNNDDQSMELTVKSKQLIKTAKTADFCSRPRPRPRPEGSRPRPRPRPGWTGLEWSRDQDRGLEDYNTAPFLTLTLNRRNFLVHFRYMQPGYKPCLIIASREKPRVGFDWNKKH